MTYKEMCETIAAANILKFQDGTQPTAEQIFNYSPTGELFMIPEWYAIAKKKLEEDAHA
jgi:hypothetical protein